MESKFTQNEDIKFTPNFTPVEESKKNLKVKVSKYLDEILPLDFKKSYFSEVKK